MSTGNPDAIVIGAGVIGGCIAYELAKRGWKALSLDMAAEAGHGSTAASCAIIRTHYSTLDGAALAHEGWFYWKDWAGYLGHDADRPLAEYRDCGCLVMKADSNDHLRPIMRNMDALGIPYEEWDEARIAAAYPFYDVANFAPAKRMDEAGFGEPTGGRLTGAVFFPRAGYVTDPALSAQNARWAAEAKGAEFRFRARVVEIRRAGGRVAGVTLEDGSRIDAPVVINVGGPHSAKLNVMAGVEEGMNIKTRALKQEVCHVPAPPGFDYERDGFVTSDGDISCYARPELGNHVLIGSEDPECDTREWVDPDDWDRNFSDQWRTQVLRKAQRIPTLPVPEQARGVVDLYDVADDWIPIYDCSDLPGFYMAIGTSGNQFKNAPVAGGMMASLVEACEAGRNHDAEPLTYHLENTARDIDIGFYSRRREINPESSFSVLG